MGHDRAKIGTDMSFWGKNRSYYRKKNCSHDQPRGEPRGKSKNNRFFARFSCLIIFFSQKKSGWLDLSVKNTHSLNFLKIFHHLVTQERRLKGARSDKLSQLISKRAARSLLFVPLVNFHLMILKINEISWSCFWNFFIRTFHFDFI